MRDELRRHGWGDEAAERVAAAVATVTAENRPGIAALDFDDTCIAGDLGDAIFHHAAAAGSLAADVLPGWRSVAPPGAPDWLAAVEHALAAGGPARAYGFVLEAFAGWPLEAFRAHCRDTLSAELEAPVGGRGSGHSSGGSAISAGRSGWCPAAPNGPSRWPSSASAWRPDGSGVSGWSSATAC